MLAPQMVWAPSTWHEHLPPSDVPPPFDGARKKVDRARRHLDEFEEAFEAFTSLADPPYYSLRNVTSRYGRGGWLLTLDRKISNDILLIAGDAIHNLRAALDHCAWELLTKFDGWGPPEGDKQRIYFPISLKSDAKYKKMLDEVASPRQDSRDFLLSFGAYPDGAGKDLVALHKLDIIDKHRLIVPVTAEVTIHGLRERSETMDGKVHIKDFPDETHALKDGDQLAPMNWGHSEPNTFIYSLAVIREYTSAPHSPKYELGGSTFTLRFAEADPFPGEAMVPALRRLADSVDEVIDKFENFVAHRDDSKARQ